MAPSTLAGWVAFAIACAFISLALTAWRRGIVDASRIFSERIFPPMPPPPMPPPSNVVDLDEARKRYRDIAHRAVIISEGFRQFNEIGIDRRPRVN